MLEAGGQKVLLECGLFQGKRSEARLRAMAQLAEMAPDSITVHDLEGRCLFANRRANRMKVLVHDGIGVWLAARRLNRGKFVWPKDAGSTLTLTRVQLDALVLGLPWQRLGQAGIITVL